MKKKGVTLTLVVLLAFASVALAGSVAYELSWFTVDGGGGESAGGGYALVGTAGQADAGALSGGDYSLVGGFWPGVEALSFRYLPIIMRR
jgi:hypothetical protein